MHTPARDRTLPTSTRDRDTDRDRPTDPPGLLFYDIGRDCGVFVT